MAPRLTEFEQAHAQSIADTDVTLAPIPPAVRFKILVGSVIRKPPVVVAALLKTLAWQQFRKPVDLHYSFITDFPVGDPNLAPVRVLLTDFVTSQPNVTLRHVGNPGDDYGDGGSTRHWTPTAWHRVGQFKNQLIQQCLDGHYDALWLVDADVLCDPYTLQSLIDADVPVVAGVYWTHWQRPVQGSAITQHAGPQVWLRHPYQLDGHGYSEPEFRAALVERKLLQVWGLGACTLFHTSALAKGVSFVPVPEGLPPGPMADGEDRHLCERARRLHLPLYADAWPDIFHAYHTSSYEHLDQWLTRLSSPRPVTPSPGDLVSFKIEMLEPVPMPEMPMVLQHLGPQIVRGRLAQLQILPEIADALAHMSAGERRIVTLRYPIHYPYATLRLQTRMIALTLLDCKPFNMAPVIGEEIFTGHASWSQIDPIALAPTQVDALLEEAHAVLA